ncbi:MAG: hypothetical protein CMI09_08945 [Oceanospirillaceae bacterium]|nr:hypothetical protein [Oceanospirillaceae bacterium]
MELNKLFLAMMAASSLALTACGSDSDSSSGPSDTDQPDTQVLTGTAATGLAMDGTVYVYDAEGRSTNVVIEDDGTFSVNVDGMTAPFMLEARPDDASLAIQYSFAEAADINVNVTPLTTLALFLANDKQSLAVLLAAWDDQAESFDETALAEAEETILANFADQFEEQSIDAETYDLFNAVFSANQTGFDAVLDDVKIVFDMDGGSFDVEVDDADYTFVPDADFDDETGGETGGETDTTPDAISFASQTDVNPDEDAFSEVVTVTGFDGEATVTITNGQFQVNNGNWATTGTISAGDSLRLFQEVPNTFETTTITTVSINGHDFSFTTTTRAADVTPDNIRFTAQAGVEPSSTVTSNTVTLAGFEGQLALSVTNGFLFVNGSEAGTSASVSAGDQIQVIQTSSGDFGTSVTSSVTLGSVATAFTTTTRAMDTTPDSFSFVSQSDVEIMAASYSNTVTLAGFDGELPISVTGNAGLMINGAPRGVTSANVSAGDTVQVVQEVVGDFGSDMVTTVTLGSYSTTFTSTIRDADTSPNAFNLTNLTDAEPGTRIESNTVTLEGFEGALTLTVTNGELRVNDDLSGASVSVEAGDEISVVQQSSADSETTVVSTVSLGDFSTTFETTTRETSTIVDVFSFVRQTDLEPGVEAISNAVTLSGFDGSQTFTLRNGIGSLIVNGTNMGTSASVSAGDSLQLAVTTSENFGWNAHAVVEFSNGSVMFIAGTRAANTVPAPFSFTSVTDVEPGVEVVSEPISFSGLEDFTRIQVTNGAVRSSRYPGQTLTSLSVHPGDSLTVVHTSSSQYETDMVTTVSTLEAYGSVSATFTSTTKAAASGQTDPVMDTRWNLGQDSMTALSLAVSPEANGTELHMLKNTGSASSLMNVSPDSSDREFAELQALASSDHEGLAVALLEQGNTSEQLIFSCDTSVQPAKLSARLASDPAAVSSLELSDTVSASLAGRASSLQEGMPWSVNACDDLSIADVIYNQSDETFQIKVGVNGAGKMNTSDYYQMAVFQYSYDLNAADASTALTKTEAYPVYRVMFGTQHYKAAEFFLDDPQSGRSFAVFKNDGSNTHNYLRMYDGGGSSVDLLISPYNKFTAEEGTWDVADMHIWMESDTAYHLYLTSETMGLYEVVYDPISKTKTSERLHTSGDQQFCKGSITGSVSGPNPTFWCHDATDEGKLIEFGHTPMSASRMQSAVLGEKPVKEKASKEEAEQIKAELEGAGAEVEVK